MERAGKDITPYKTERSGKVGWIAGAAALGAIGTGFLIAGLVKGDGDDKVPSSATDNQMTVELDLLMNNAMTVFGVVENQSLKLVPLPTTVNTYAPIVLINGYAVAVVDYREHRFPYWVNPSSARWEPLLGIGDIAGWFNTYENPNNSGISFIDRLSDIMNEKLNPRTVLYFAAPNATGGQLPTGAKTAFGIINTEFPGGVLQGAITQSADRQLYDSNYNRIKHLF